MDKDHDTRQITNRFFKPLRLMDKATANPTSCLREIFQLFSLEDLKQTLMTWVKAALSSDRSNYEGAHERAALIAFTEQVLPLMEALYLKSEVVKHQKSWIKKLPRKLQKKLPWHTPLSYLTTEQINHPSAIIRAFCNLIPISYSRSELWDLLDGMISYEGDNLTEETDKQSLLLYYDCFAALLEAAYRLHGESGP